MKYIQLSKLFYKNKNQFEDIYNNRFNNESTIHIPVNINGNPAFIVYSDEILNLITSIYKADKKLSSLVNTLPNIALEQFTAKCLIDEIKLSNDIEGVHSTRKEIKALLSPTTKEKTSKRLYGLVQKYLMLTLDEEISIQSCRDIRNIYDDLVLREVVEEDPANAPDGIYFRKEPVSVQGADLKIIHNGVNPEEQIITYIQEGLNLLYDSNINIMISVATFHYLIGYAHPFYDGNGRLSRFISSYFLSKELHPLIGYSLSYTVKKQLRLYYKAFKIVNEPKNRGDITPFVIIFLELIKEAFDGLNQTLLNKREQLDYYFYCTEKISTNDNIKELLFILVQNTLFGYEGLSIDELSEITKFSIPAIRNYIHQSAPELFDISKSGKKFLYNINLDYFN